MSRARIFPEGSEVVGADEVVLWKGRPSVLALAKRMFHVRAIIGYFFVLAAWNLASAHADGFRANAALIAAGWVVLPALAAAAFIYAMAWVFAATTHYTITDKRVIMQIGVALPIGLTLPLRRIQSAGLKLHPDGSGDIPLTLGDQKIAYLLVWPHARPWRLKSPEPMLRCVPNAREAATVLSRALLAATPTGEAIAIEPAAPLRAPHGEPAVAGAYQALSHT